MSWAMLALGSLIVVIQIATTGVFVDTSGNPDVKKNILLGLLGIFIADVGAILIRYGL